MAEEQEPVRRRFSWSYLFSFILIVGIIVTVIVLLFGRNTAKEFTAQEFLNNLGNNRITEITETPKENTIVAIEGYYSPANATKPTKKKFKLNISYYEYYEKEYTWTYFDDSNKEHYLVDDA